MFASEQWLRSVTGELDRIAGGGDPATFMAGFDFPGRPRAESGPRAGVDLRGAR